MIENRIWACKCKHANTQENNVKTQLKMARSGNSLCPEISTAAARGEL